MGISPSYSVVGNNELKNFFDSPYDEKKTKEKLMHQGALPAQFTVSFGPPRGIVLRTSLLAAKILFCPIYLPYLFFQGIVRICVLPATVLFRNSENLAKLRLDIMDPLNEGVNLEKQRLFYDFLAVNRDFIEKYGLDRANKIRKNFSLEVKLEKPVIERFTIDVDGTAVDICLRGKPSILKNGKWILAAMPNAACYEQLLCQIRRSGSDTEENRNLVLDLANELDANIISFNYPEVGDSKGPASPEMMGKAYKAVLLILEKEIKATKIIHYGWSMGGGAQALGLDGWKGTEGIEHICVKDRSFCSIAEAAKGMMGPILGRIAKVAVRFAGCDMDSRAASSRLTYPEIILQTGRKEELEEQRKAYSRSVGRGHNICAEMGFKEEIEDDEVLSASSTLGYALAGQTHVGKKYYLVTTAEHCGGMIAIEKITDLIRASFGEQKPLRKPLFTPPAASLWERVRALSCKAKSYFAA